MLTRLSTAPGTLPRPVPGVFFGTMKNVAPRGTRRRNGWYMMATSPCRRFGSSSRPRKTLCVKLLSVGLSALFPHPSDDHNNSPLNRLSPVESEVLRLYCSDMSLKQIAWHLKVTPKEVADYKYSLMSKLGCKSNLRLVVLAVKLGLIADESPSPPQINDVICQMEG